VLHVLEAVGGGTLRHLVDVVRTVKGVEHHVVVPPVPRGERASTLLANGVSTQDMVDAGAVIHHLPMKRNPLSVKNALSVFRLRRLIRELQPVAIHGHSSVGGAFARAANIGQPIPSVYTPHGLAMNRSILAVERLLVPLTDRLIAVSEGEAARAIDHGLTSDDHLVVIANGIDLSPTEESDFDLRARLGLPAEVPIVGTVARLVPQKDPAEFVRVCAAVHRRRADAHFVLVGRGELQSEVDAAVREAGIASHFHQIEFLPRAADAIEQFDVLVLTSAFEGAAYTPLEAMRVGVPVILSDVAGNSEVVEHETSGLLFPLGSTSAAAHDVLRMLSDVQLRDTLVDAATRRVEELFDVQDMAAKLESLYEELSSSQVLTSV
jgi:glycosyltransferase involved in cell wall biosynthesis